MGMAIFRQSRRVFRRLPIKASKKYATTSGGISAFPGGVVLIEYRFLNHTPQVFSFLVKVVFSFLTKAAFSFWSKVSTAEINFQ